MKLNPRTSVYYLHTRGYAEVDVVDAPRGLLLVQYFDWRSTERKD